MRRVAIRAGILLAATIAAAATTRWIPSEDGGLLPSGLLLLAVAARVVRLRTCPDSRCAGRVRSRAV